jgi:GTP-binding protein
VNTLRATQTYLDDYNAQHRNSDRTENNDNNADSQQQLTVQLFSALKRIGLDEAHQIIERWTGTHQP